MCYIDPSLFTLRYKNIYKGKSVKRLLDIRWTDDLQITKTVSENYSEIISALEQVNNYSVPLDGKDIAVGIRLLNVIKKKTFVFLLTFMADFLETIGPVDRILQSPDLSYHRAMPLLEILQSDIMNYRSVENFDKFMKLADDIIPTQAEVARRSQSGQRTDDVKAIFFEIIDITS